MRYSFNIKDTKDTEVCDDFCEDFGYEPTVRDAEGNISPNPESKHDFAERILKQIFVEPFITKRKMQGAQLEGDKARGEL